MFQIMTVSCFGKKVRMHLLGLAEGRATTRSLPPEVLERAGLPKSDAKGSDAADR